MPLRKTKFIILAAIPFLLALPFMKLSSRSYVKTISLLYAGSLINIVEEDLKPRYEEKSNLSLEAEGYGALTCARLIKEGLRSPDLLISADSQVIENELMGKENDNLVRGYLEFASNRMVIAYSKESRFYLQLEKVRRGEFAWHEILTKPGFRLGRTDPNLDPKGYRMIFVAKLAEKYYQKPGLAGALLGEDSDSLIYRETQLMTRLEIGDIDAAETYANEAIERDFSFIELPPEVNLGDPSLENVYGEVSFRANTGEIYRGSPIVFALAIPEKAKDGEKALGLARFILSREGLEIFRQHGFQTVKQRAVGEVPVELLDYEERKND